MKNVSDKRKIANIYFYDIFSNLDLPLHKLYAFVTPQWLGFEKHKLICKKSYYESLSWFNYHCYYYGS